MAATRNKKGAADVVARCVGKQPGEAGASEDSVSIGIDVTVIRKSVCDLRKLAASPLGPEYTKSVEMILQTTEGACFQQDMAVPLDEAVCIVGEFLAVLPICSIQKAKSEQFVEVARAFHRFRIARIEHDSLDAKVFDAAKLHAMKTLRGAKLAIEHLHTTSEPWFHVGFVAEEKRDRRRHERI